MVISVASQRHTTLIRLQIRLSLVYIDQILAARTVHNNNNLAWHGNEMCLNK